MKISHILQSGRGAFPSLEIVPPLKGISRTELIEGIRPMMEFHPPYINVTNHRDEYEFIPRPDRSFERRVVRNRVDASAVCAAVKAEFDVEVVPHIICAGTTASDIESELSNYRFLEIENVMALRGDSMVGEKRFTPEPGGYAYASELVGAIAQGKFSGEFCVGVGAYPEKHFEAPNIETDIANLKRKVDAGADFVITQMFFDNAVYYSFVERCRAAGITVPILPGIKPLSSVRQLTMLPEAFSLDIPKALTDEVQAHPESSYVIGQEWALAQCRDLLAHGVPAIHFYTMGKSNNVTGIIKECF